MALTDTQIRKLKPTDKCTPNRPDKYSDNDGLQLWVRHTGSKVWICAYRYQNKQQSLTLGKYPAMSLSEARQRLLEIKEMLASGVNPRIERDKQKTLASGVMMFDSLANRWFSEKHQQGVTAKTYQRDFNQYQRDIKPFIGHKDIDKITPNELLDIAKRIENRGSLTMGKRALQKIGQVYM
ncbi:tyrosine-type recombinase/integrase [Moraxella boevrei]|uniref:tyrosine-type recombinase/integrase n=1 Tax=Faucicola boevrei TaxID=346665 RepID=UPI003736D56C